VFRIESCLRVAVLERISFRISVRIDLFLDQDDSEEDDFSHDEELEEKE
jgi:hypothetical protein